MEIFSNSVAIDRPVDEVFAFLSDFENVPKWNHAIAETRKSSPGPVAVGATYVQRRQIPKPSEEGFRVTELAPGRRLAVEGTLGSFPAKLRYELEPSEQEPSSSTRSSCKWPAHCDSSGEEPPRG